MTPTAPVVVPTVVLVVVVEGTSDVEYFPQVMTALLEDVLSTRREQVLAEVRVELFASGEAGRFAWLRDHVARAHADAHVVAVHVDGTSDPERELRKSFEPLTGSWPSEGARLLPLVPVREMEAWALADLEVVREAVGVDWDVSLIRDGGNLARPERLPTPKETLADLLAQARRPRRRRRSTASYLPFIAENTPLSALRRLPSFRAFEADLTGAIDDIHRKEPT